MGGILSFLQNAIAPAAVARAGYLQGQTQEEDKRRAEAIQDAAIKRQSILDQIRARLDASQVGRNNAQAYRYERMNTTPPPTPAPRTVRTKDGIRQWNPDTKQYEVTDMEPPAPTTATSPRTVNTKEGIMQWDPDTKTWKATGMQAPDRSNSTGKAQERLDAKTALDEATKVVPRPSKVPANVLGKDAKGRATMVPNPDIGKVTADSLAYEKSTLQPLRQHLLDVTIGDKVKLGDAPRAGTTGAPPLDGGRPTSGPRYKLSPDQSAAMQKDFDAANGDLQAVLNSGAPESVKKQARALYDQQQTSIAKKYGTGVQPDDQDDDEQ